MSRARAQWAAAALFGVVLSSAGCAMQSSSVPRDPSWMKRQVTGTRIARRWDARGEPIAESPVNIISGQTLRDAPGLTLGEKLTR
jgi:hypothetical protein